jgi:plastocyanin
MHPIGVANAASVFAETSKIPFYVAGCVLAAWAVSVAVTGVTHPGFPSSRGLGRLVMLTSVVLVAATVSSAVLTASDQGETQAAEQAGQPPGAQTLDLAADKSGQIAFDKRRLTATAGTVTIRFDNATPVPHNVVVGERERDIAKTPVIHSDTTSLTTDLRPGQYVYYCAVDAHRELGMHGTLTVR